jgi:hypothetical protein
MSISPASGLTLKVAPLTRQPAPVERNKDIHAVSVTQLSKPSTASPVRETSGHLNVTA